MTGDKVKEVATKYEVFLQEQYRTTPGRNMEAYLLEDRLKHLHWMCVQIREFVDADRIDKAFRWLGFLQGAFWVLGIYSIEEAKKDNTPDGVQFDKQKV